jgi:hypothetical protein
MLIPWYVTFARLLAPVLILSWPFWGIVATMFVDTVDWKFIQVVTSSDNIAYQAWDKMMDLYSWIFILWILRSWKDVWARKVAIMLFGYRLIGMILFWITGRKSLLFFFPNVFENFVILTLLLFWQSNKQKLGLSRSNKIIMLLVLIVPKFIHEYFQHLLGRQPWEIFDVGKTLGFLGTTKELTNNLIWGVMLYAIPILGFLLYMRKVNGNKSLKS